MPKDDHAAQPSIPPLTAKLWTELPHRKLSWRLLAVALVFSLCGLAAMGADIPISKTLREMDFPGDLAKGISLSEVFGHTLGAAAILLSVLLLAPRRRRAIGVAILITFTSGLTADLLKGCFVRVRPHSFGVIRVAQPGEYEFAPGYPGPRLADGRELVPIRLTDPRQRSFPSGHAATAWGLALGLSFAFPRGVLLFACFALLASLQRVTSGAHYPTDVMAGAAIPFIVTALFLSIPPLKRWLST